MAIIPTNSELLDLIYSDRTDALVSSCNSLSDNGSVDALNAMLLAFRDDDDYFDEMSVLLHSIERAPVSNVYIAIRNCILELNDTAPSWCKRIVKRNLLADEGPLTRFDTSDFVKALKGNEVAFKLVRQIARELFSTDQISGNVMQHLN